MMRIALIVNGRPVKAAVEPRLHLADFLRETQNLTGTHLGCEHGICGACTLLIDSVPARSCITYAVACDGASVTTIEGLDADEIAAELREAFSREHALQCGYCTPGMLISARDLVLRLERPSEHDIRLAMSGNLCRCTGYVGIIRGIDGVIAARRSRGIAALPGAGRSTLGPVGSGHSGAMRAEPALVPVGRSPGAAARADIAAAVDASPPAEFVPTATIDRSFAVAYPRDRVWAFFSDLRRVAACLPGASITGEPDCRRAEGKFRVKVGPITADLRGAAEVARDTSTYSGRIFGGGRDRKSNSAVRATISYRLLPIDDGRSTQVQVGIGYALSGMLAQLGRSDLVLEIATGLIDVFSKNLETALAGSGAAGAGMAAPELNAGRLLLSALRRWVKTWLTARLGGR
jgi:aerobic carbon-monoxide dehydrogenase small subunit